ALTPTDLSTPSLHDALPICYRRLRGEVPDEDYVVPLGQADIKRAGRDLSIITYGIGVHLALEASEQLASEGIDVEIVDLRTLLRSEERRVGKECRAGGQEER